MRILDIDLDFFLDNIAHSQDGLGTKRLDCRHYKPWNSLDIEAFLEKKCGLSKESPVSGKCFTHHHEVFKFWRELINQGQLKTPFELDHIDAHSDTGLGDCSFEYIMTEILHRPVEGRSYPEEEPFKKLGPGNYLAFALACRWIKRVTFVPPACQTPTDWSGDILALHLKNFDVSSGHFQLKKYTVQQFEERWSFIPGLREVEPIALEPEVPFHIVSLDDFQADKPYSFVSLTQSPTFTPKTSDKLIPVIMQYMDEMQLDSEGRAGSGDHC